MWYTDLFNINLTADSTNIKQKKLAKMKNDILFINTFTKLVTDGLARYKLNGLPDTISERVVLQSLFWYGSVVIFEKGGALFGLPGVQSGDGVNINCDPGSAWVFSCNGKLNEKVKLYLPGSDEASFLKETTTGEQTGTPKGVYIRENALAYPLANWALYYADVISDTYRTLDVCRNNLKRPYLIFAEESVVRTVQDYFKRRDNNEEYIIGTGIFDPSKVNLLEFTSNADSISSVIEMLDWYENKWRELCGKENNAQIDKKGENLIESEVSINNEYTELMVDKCLPYLKEGFDTVNRLFGTNITVERVENKSEEVTEYDDFSGDTEEDTRG